MYNSRSLANWISNNFFSVIKGHQWCYLWHVLCKDFKIWIYPRTCCTLFLSYYKLSLKEKFIYPFLNGKRWANSEFWVGRNSINRKKSTTLAVHSLRLLDLRTKPCREQQKLAQTLGGESKVSGVRETSESKHKNKHVLCSWHVPLFYMAAKTCITSSSSIVPLSQFCIINISVHPNIR